MRNPYTIIIVHNRKARIISMKGKKIQKFLDSTNTNLYGKKEKLVCIIRENLEIYLVNLIVTKNNGDS